MITAGAGRTARRELLAVGGPASSSARSTPLWRFEVRTPTLPPATHTNVYILGEGELLVVDPASPYPEERAALRDALADRLAAGERVAAIVLTHQHIDHVSGADDLRSATGAPIFAHAETARHLQGRITIDRAIGEGDRLPAGGLDLEAIFTPGHAPGHLCLLEHGTRAIVCGDMVASTGTIVIDPDDDGDMTAYLASLARLRTLQPSVLLPAHGPPIWDADEHLAHYLAHRLAREDKVVAALDATPRTLDELVLVAYADTDAALHPLAKRSLRAYLLKLAREGRATAHDDRWSLTCAGPSR